MSIDNITDRVLNTRLAGTLLHYKKILGNSLNGRTGLRLKVADFNIPHLHLVPPVEFR